MDTKAKIAGILGLLLKEKNFNNITVQEIIESSNVSKSTFYRHFRDKYEIVEYECDKCLMFFYTDIPVNPNILQNMHRNLFEYVYSNRDFYSAIVKIDGQNSFEKIFSQSGMKIFYTKYSNKDISEELKRITELYCYGFAMLLKDWVAHGFKKSPEYMSKITCECIPEIIKKNF